MSKQIIVDTIRAKPDRRSARPAEIRDAAPPLPRRNLPLDETSGKPAQHPYRVNLTSLDHIRPTMLTPPLAHRTEPPVRAAQPRGPGPVALLR